MCHCLSQGTHQLWHITRRLCTAEETMQMLGYDVEVINYIKQLSFMQKVNWMINALRCDGGKAIRDRLKGSKDLEHNPAYAANIKVRTEAVEAYKERKFIPLFKDYRGYEALHNGSKNYDAVVVGSDQVWTPLSLPTKFYNLLFVDDSIRKVAYASSFGVSVIPNFQKKATGAYLDRFYRIGVREIKGKEIVDSLSHQKATVVADPTLLLSWKNGKKKSRRAGLMRKNLISSAISSALIQKLARLPINSRLLQDIRLSPCVTWMSIIQVMKSLAMRRLTMSILTIF